MTIASPCETDRRCALATDQPMCAEAQHSPASLPSIPSREVFGLPPLADGHRDEENRNTDARSGRWLRERHWSHWAPSTSKKKGDWGRCQGGVQLLEYVRPAPGRCTKFQIRCLVQVAFGVYFLILQYFLACAGQQSVVLRGPQT